MHDTTESFRERTQQPVELAKLEASFVPPPHFAKASFANYKPYAEFPTQAGALTMLKAYVHDIKREHPNVIARLLGRKAKKDLPHGLYLDGGFGVGKTHLLAAAFHAYHGKKAFLSFQELMFYVGLKTLAGAVDSLARLELLVVDEFELDDPANTRIVTNLLNQLFDRGVHVLTSSNTPPGGLGEGKFSVRDFARELGALTAHFELVRVDGDDYRLTHPHAEDSTHWLSPGSVLPSANITLAFDTLMQILSGAHPMRIRQSLAGVRSIALTNVKQIEDAHAALRFVYFVDKIYDNDARLWVTSSIPLNELYQQRYFHGGDTKKYLRSLSRLKELTGG